jgi:hypothetical protein
VREADLLPATGKLDAAGLGAVGHGDVGLRDDQAHIPRLLEAWFVESGEGAARAERFHLRDHVRPSPGLDPVRAAGRRVGGVEVELEDDPAGREDLGGVQPEHPGDVHLPGRERDAPAVGAHRLGPGDAQIAAVHPDHVGGVRHLRLDPGRAAEALLLRIELEFELHQRRDHGARQPPGGDAGRAGVRRRIRRRGDAEGEGTSEQAVAQRHRKLSVHGDDASLAGAAVPAP